MRIGFLNFGLGTVDTWKIDETVHDGKVLFLNI